MEVPDDTDVQWLGDEVDYRFLTVMRYEREVLADPDAYGAGY